MSTACLLPGGPSLGTSSTTSSPAVECQTDIDCSSSSTCRQYQCIEHKCQENDAPDGVAVPNYGGASLRCQKLVCDGHGSTHTLPDPTAIPTDTPPACKQYECDASGNAILAPNPNNVPTATSTPCKKTTCDASGNATSVPDPSNTPVDTPNDCRVDQCDANGNVTKAPDPADVPVDQKGDCKKSTCTAAGTASTAIDDTDPPAPTTCFAYTCSNGTPKGTPINPTTTCSTYGFVCGADGSCSTCPTPDAACDDTGPGSRTSSSAHDFGGIGQTDTGGRDFCGAVPAGQTEYYTYYDDGTGFLAQFDPYFEIRPQAAANMCVYFDCPSISCPVGTTTGTLSGHPGCCWDAAAGSFTGRSINFCAGARVTLAVTSKSGCAGYELHFHD